MFQEVGLHEMPQPSRLHYMKRWFFCNPLINVWHIPKIPEWVLTDVLSFGVGLADDPKCSTIIIQAAQAGKITC